MNDLSPTVVSKRPLVSVVITVYNRAHLLKRALESVLTQTVRDIEVVVVDDASSDDPEQVVADAADPRIRYIRLEQNHGAAGARSRGFAEARGAYVANLDSDDEWLPDKLERQIAVFEASEWDDLGVVYGSVVYVFEDGRETLARASARGDIRPELLRRGPVVTGAFNTTLIRRDVVEHIGEQDLSNPCREDFDYFLRISEHYRFDYVADPVLRMTKFGTDRISSHGRKRVLALIRVLKQHREAYRSLKGSRYFGDHMMIAKYLAWMGRYRMATRVFLYTATRIAPPSLRWMFVRDYLVVPAQIGKAYLRGGEAK